jgi:SH3 domain protein
MKRNILPGSFRQPINNMKWTVLPMKRILLVCTISMLLAALSVPPSFAMNTAYVSDLCQVHLRSGPGTNFKILAAVSSGFIVELLGQKDNWSNVRIVKEGGESTEGWIMNKYLADQPPWAAQEKTMSASLTEQLAAVTEEKNQLGKRETELTNALQVADEKLHKLEADYQALRTGSADYLKLKQLYDATNLALSEAQENLRTLSKQIEDSKFSQKIKWSMAGGMVFLCGWLIGVAMGRYQKRPRIRFRN